MPSWQEVALGVAVLLSTLFTIFIATAPNSFDPYHPDFVIEDEEMMEKRKAAYGDFIELPDFKGKQQVEFSCQVVVLGDTGRSPRMQYHALSIAKHGGRVDLIGYQESDVHPMILADPRINVVPLASTPKLLQTSNKILFLLLAPLKVILQIWTVYYALGYRTKPAKWILAQNPPAIPTLFVVQFISFLRNSKLAIDWHNFGYTILAMKLGQRHPLVQVAALYEGLFGRAADTHFAVSKAMVRALNNKWAINAVTLYDRPAEVFQTFTSQDERAKTLKRLPETAQYANDILSGSWRLIVSPTSWTSDEDFGIFLDAMVQYSAAASDSSKNKKLPFILAIITGKGPQKEYYLERIKKLNQDKKLAHVIITTAFLSLKDYAFLLAASDLGISLHTSSSGVDLPMKILDMFGAGLPVLGWNKYEAWKELVREGENGEGFDSGEEMCEKMIQLFGGGGPKLEELRPGARKEGESRWDAEWDQVAGKEFKLVK